MLVQVDLILHPDSVQKVINFESMFPTPELRQQAEEGFKALCGEPLSPVVLAGKILRVLAIVNEETYLEDFLEVSQKLELEPVLRDSSAWAPQSSINDAKLDAKQAFRNAAKYMYNFVKDLTR